MGKEERKSRIPTQWIFSGTLRSAPSSPRPVAAVETLGWRTALHRSRLFSSPATTPPQQRGVRRSCYLLHTSLTIAAGIIVKQTIICRSRNRWTRRKRGLTIITNTHRYSLRIRLPPMRRLLQCCTLLLTAVRAWSPRWRPAAAAHTADRRHLALSIFLRTNGITQQASGTTVTRTVVPSPKGSIWGRVARPLCRHLHCSIRA